MRRLLVVVYHYIRHPEQTAFPRIHFLHTDEFCRQIEFFKNGFEMATLETALAFLNGEYQPSKHLVLLTFDDGLKEHWAFVTPFLQRHGIQGSFFLMTSSELAPVHMNHFLMASMDIAQYRAEFLRILPDAGQYAFDDDKVSWQYPYDAPEVGRFKYLMNFVVPPSTRDAVLRKLFEEHLGDPREFANSLYVSWAEAREMQEAGMVIGGHSHNHKPLEPLPDIELGDDLATCRQVLDDHLHPQAVWPFCYPYGKVLSFGPRTAAHLKRLGFQCGFTTENGSNVPGADVFSLRRFDCKDVIATLTPFSIGSTDQILV